MKAYYEQLAPEYDDWWLGTGRFEERDRPGWHAEVAALVAALAALAPARTLDVACGLGGGAVVHAGRWFVAVRA